MLRLPQRMPRGMSPGMDEGSAGEREAGLGLRVELFVRDVARSVAFYRDVLGFEVARTAPDGYTAVRRDGAEVGLNDVARLPDGHPVRPEPGQSPGRGVELVIMARDVAGAHARAMAACGTVTVLVRQPWGLTDFRVVDPDGYYIRVTSVAPQ